MNWRGKSNPVHAVGLSQFLILINKSLEKDHTSTTCSKYIPFSEPYGELIA